MTDEDVCRICRGEETIDDPLYHPCRCAGSIKFVHRECLLEWLQHARLASKCELCGARYTMVQRYKPDMPRNLYLSDYAAHAAHKFVENIPFMFLCVRGVFVVSCLAILTKYALEFSTIASNRVFYTRMMSSSWHILRERGSQQPPRSSGAPALDWLLSFVLPASEIRSAWVDGMCILAFSLFLFIMLWVITMWVLNEPAVIHDLEHIGLGEISHMDNGDDDMVEFDELNPANDNLIEGERNLAARLDHPADRPHGHFNHPERVQRGENVEPHGEQRQQHQEAAMEFQGNDQRVYVDHLRDNGSVEMGDSLANPTAGPANNNYAPSMQSGEERNSAVNENFAASGDRTSFDEDENHAHHPEDMANHEGIYQDARVPERGDQVPIEENAEEHIDAVPVAQDNLALREEEEAEEDAEELEALGFAVRGLIYEIFGGTNAETLGEFGIVAFSTIALVEFVYMIPYIIIRIHWRLVGAVLMKYVPQIVLPIAQWELLDSESLPVHFTVIAVHALVGMIFLRYIELRSMPYLLKRQWGISFVTALYQFYAVLKSLLMMIIEFFAFPQLCGSLMHLVMVPLTPTLSDHWHLCKQHPYLFMFAHWLAGFLYMHGVMIFVNTCRKFFRRGVLYFVHDGEAPDFIRAIVFVSVPRQIYRICISAALYGFFILIGMGSVTLSLAKVMPPLNVTTWPGLSILRLWPLFVFGHAYFVPFVPSGLQLNKVVSSWFREEVWLYVLRFAARLLDLESWLFGKKRLLTERERAALQSNDTSLGNFVRAPQSSRFRDRKNLILFVPVDENNKRLDENKSGKPTSELSQYTIVWRPRFFWVRIIGLAFIVWASATLLMMLLTLVPLSVGRVLDRIVYGSMVLNDLVSYLAGLSICLPIYGQLIRRHPPSDMLTNPALRGLKGELPFPEGRSWFLIFIWTLLFTGIQIASPKEWAHWAVIWPLNAKTMIANFVITYVAGLFAHAWTNAIAVSDFMLFQQLLEVTGAVPPTKWKCWAAVQPVLTMRLWQRWSQSKQAQRWSTSVRDYMYLDGTELKNYSE